MKHDQQITKETFDAIRPDWIKWDTAKLLKGVIWVCKNCGEKIDDGKLIEQPFMGSVHCGECGAMLTERQNGGTNPFNMTFVDPNEPIGNSEQLTLPEAIAKLETEGISEKERVLEIIKFVASELSGDPSDGETDTGTWILEQFSDVYPELNPYYDKEEQLNQHQA